MLIYLLFYLVYANLLKLKIHQERLSAVVGNRAAEARTSSKAVVLMEAKLTVMVFICFIF